MKFSIVTPCFNGLPALRQCIGSIRAQVAAEAQRLPGRLVSECGSQIRVHHHIQDGGSTDGTIDWLEHYANEVRGQGVRREALGGREIDSDAQSPTTNAYSFSFSSEKDEGMYDAINKGWDRADGDILAWLNCDEQYLPGTLQKVGNFFQQYPDEDAVFGNMIIVTADGEPFAARREIPLRRTYVANSFLYAASCTTFYRKRALEKSTIRLDTRFRFASDMDMVLRLLGSGVRYGHINDYLSLFSVETGRNLSFSDEMLRETRLIQRENGAVSSNLGKKGIQSVRWVERFLNGCYKKHSAHYLFALNEIPEYREVYSARLNCRFSYSEFAKRVPIAVSMGAQ